MIQTIGQSIAAATSAHGRMALILLEIDRFKGINDIFGRSTADQLLVQMADRLQERLREVDVVGRFGSDAIAIVLPDGDANYAAIVADQVLEIASKPFLVTDLVLPIAVHVGISVYPEDGVTVETLVKRADAALYKGRSQGRNVISLQHHDIVDRAHDRITLASALREAVAAGQLTLCYQPQINLADGTLHAVEALLRWTHPVLGDVSASRFIQIAEQIGLIEDIGIWALGEACRQMAQWRESGRRVPAISVNLSPLQFRNRNLPTIVAHLLERYDIPRHALMIEITEGVMMDENPAILETIVAIQALGVGLSMDDFGTGYSGLSRLTQIPFSEVKIDRSFINRLSDDRGARVIVTAINQIGRSLDITVVAEGVETERQREILEELGCRVGQGYLFSHPLNSTELEGWLIASKGSAANA